MLHLWHRILTGYDINKQDVVNEAKPVDHESQLNSWIAHADAILFRMYFF
jgi:hypothetical protein